MPRSGASQARVRLAVFEAGQVPRQWNFPFINREMIWILGGEPELVDEHLVLPFSLDVIPNLRAQRQPV